LFWASLAGGLGAPLTLFFLIRIACDRTAMGTARVGKMLSCAGWVVGAVVTLSATLFLLTALGARTSG
jgi:Mn2+/Fe2+ NRAMP family transporter